VDSTSKYAGNLGKVGEGQHLLGGPDTGEIFNQLSHRKSSKRGKVLDRLIGDNDNKDVGERCDSSRKKAGQRDGEKEGSTRREGSKNETHRKKKNTEADLVGGAFSD